MQETVKTIGEIIAIFGAVGGFLGWLLSGLLNNKKEILTLRIYIEQLQKDIRELEDLVDKNHDSFEKYKDRGLFQCPCR